MLENSPHEKGQLVTNMAYMVCVCVCMYMHIYIYTHTDFLGNFEPLSSMNQKSKRSGLQSTCK